MKTIEERIEALEALPKRGRWASAVEEDLRASAIRYANLVTFNMSVEPDGSRAIMCAADAKELADYEAKKMRSIAVQLLRELAIEEVAR